MHTDSTIRNMRALVCIAVMGAALVGAQERAGIFRFAPVRPVMIFDGYRPWYVTKIFSDATPRTNAPAW